MTHNQWALVVNLASNLSVGIAEVEAFIRAGNFAAAHDCLADLGQHFVGPLLLALHRIGEDL